jgi:hypothetical protein
MGFKERLLSHIPEWLYKDGLEVGAAPERQMTSAEFEGRKRSVTPEDIGRAIIRPEDLGLTPHDPEN